MGHLRLDPTAIRPTTIVSIPPHFDRGPLRDPIGFHVTIRLEDGRPIATVPAARRIVARVVLVQGERRGLLAYGAADSHIHAVLRTNRAAAGAFAHYVESSLRWQLALGAPFERARVRPLHDQRHAYNAFHYAHRQDSRHALSLDDMREARSLPDLLGLRALQTSLVARVRAHLPRVGREELLGAFPAGAFDEALPVDLEVLAEAATAALALLDLHARSPDGSRARCAAVHAVGPDVSASRLSDCLEIGVRAVQSLRSRPSEPLVTLAVQKQARLMAASKRARGAVATVGTAQLGRER